MTNISRATLHISPGQVVLVNNAECVIDDIIDFKSIVVKDLDTNEKSIVSISDMVLSDTVLSKAAELDTVNKKAVTKALDRYNAIKPMLEGRATVKDLREIAKQQNVALSALYRWKKNYLAEGSLEGLIPKKTGTKKGTKYIQPEVEKIINDFIQNFYLTKSRPSIKKLVRKIRLECLRKDIENIPHKSTIRRRLSELTAYESLFKRHGREAAKRRHDPTLLEFPNADFPGAVVQIDNTPANIILVDDIDRMPIGKPIICLAICVWSRMIMGYYLSFDAPSALSTAMCITHSVLPKEDWMKLHDVQGEWPVWGLMKEVHSDNGSEFRNESLTLGCDMNNIALAYRPPGKPQFGGHIERVLGTINGDIHDLDGTTYANIQQKGDYDSEKNANMTLGEFEKWLVHIICNVYHNEPHDAIDMAPIEKWRIGIFGDKHTIGMGLPQLPKNLTTFMLDMMPMTRRTVQRSGIEWDHFYFSDELRRWVNEYDKDDPSKKRKFIVRRDPRDISFIWFYDDELETYFKIPYANQSIPRMSLAEYKSNQRKKNKAKKLGREEELAQLEAYEELDTMRQESEVKTKKARMQRQKKRINAKRVTPDAPLEDKEKSNDADQQFSPDFDFEDEDFSPKGDVSW